MRCRCRCRGAERGATPRRPLPCRRAAPSCRAREHVGRRHTAERRGTPTIAFRARNRSRGARAAAAAAGSSPSSPRAAAITSARTRDTSTGSSRPHAPRRRARRVTAAIRRADETWSKAPTGGSTSTTTRRWRRRRANRRPISSEATGVGRLRGAMVVGLGVVGLLRLRRLRRRLLRAARRPLGQCGRTMVVGCSRVAARGSSPL